MSQTKLGAAVDVAESHSLCNLISTSGAEAKVKDLFQTSRLRGLYTMRYCGNPFCFVLVSEQVAQ